MFVPLVAVCYFSWFTKQGVAFGIVLGITAVILTDGIGQSLFENIIPWNKWPLTISNIYKNTFKIWVIPHTLKLTNLSHLKINDFVNIEIDILSKYVKKFLNAKKKI